MNNEDYVLKVKTESGRDLEINVMDIFESEQYKKEYIIYTINSDTENIYASVLVEDENSFELNTIPTQEEYDYINTKIEALEIN